jgi:HK97 family phage prohead protease
MKEFSFTLDIKRSKELVQKGDWVIVGYATTYDVKNDNLHITREALDEAKGDLLEKYSTVLFNHNPDRPIGKIVEAETDELGLLVKMVLSKSEEEIWEKVKDGTINKFSIQGRILESRPIEGDEYIIQVTKIKLFEAGLVSVPGDAGAKTISHWVARSLLRSDSNTKEMKDLIKKLKSIQNRSDETVKSDIENLIKEIENRVNVIDKLQILAEKLEGDEKDAVENAIGMLKREEKEEKKEKEDDELEEAQYNLADTSENRPIFQLNSEDDLQPEGKTKNRFRKQLLTKGKWYHWAADGNVLNITDEIIESIVKNFKKKVVDNVFVPLTHTNDPSKNTGEVVALEKTENGLDAVIEIKDKNILEKIKDKLIKGISASIDPNYLVKTSNKFIGPTLLHAALVTEPFIKGMDGFIPLSDELTGRTVIQLEDEKPNFYTLFEMIKETLNKIENKIMTEEKVKETIAAAKEEDVSEAKKEGDPCEKDDGTKGKMKKVDGKLVCEALGEDDELNDDDKKEGDDEKEEKVEEKNTDEYVACLEKETKEGKTIAEAVNMCKAKLSLDPTEDSTEDKSDEKSDGDKEDAKEKVDLSDAEGVYEKYLREGKIVPAQKDAFIELFASSKVLDLGDEKVGLAKTLEAFLKSQPKVVNFEEKGAAGSDETTGKKEEETEKNVPAEALTFFKGMGLSDEDSTKAWEESKRIVEDEKKAKESTLFE